MKVEDGLLDGEVLFHELVHKTEEEKVKIQKSRDAKKKLKENRKKVQEENKKKKESKKEEEKQKSLKGMRKQKSESDVLMQKAAKESYEGNLVEDDDDAQYFRDEVGQEPDKGEESQINEVLMLMWNRFLLQICSREDRRLVISVQTLIQSSIKRRE